MITPIEKQKIVEVTQSMLRFWEPSPGFLEGRSSEIIYPLLTFLKETSNRDNQHLFQLEGSIQKKLMKCSKTGLPIYKERFIAQPDRDKRLAIEQFAKLICSLHKNHPHLCPKFNPNKEISPLNMDSWKQCLKEEAAKIKSS